MIDRNEPTNEEWYEIQRDESEATMKVLVCLDMFDVVQSTLVIPCDSAEGWSRIMADADKPWCVLRVVNTDALISVGDTLNYGDSLKANELKPSDDKWLRARIASEQMAAWTVIAIDRKLRIKEGDTDDAIAAAAEISIRSADALLRELSK